MKYGTIEWVREYFPEYVIDGSLIWLTVGVWPITGKVTTPEGQPWRYAPNVPDGKTPNMQGYVVQAAKYSAPPYTRYTSQKVSDAEFRAYCDTLNWFRNGNKSMKGGPGLDPRLLIGGHAKLGRVYTCPKGKYTKGTPAQFEFNNGTFWVG